MNICNFLWILLTGAYSPQNWNKVLCVTQGPALRPQPWCGKFLLPWGVYSPCVRRSAVWNSKLGLLSTRSLMKNVSGFISCLVLPVIIPPHPARHVSCSVVDALKVSCSAAQHATEERRGSETLTWDEHTGRLDTVDNGRHYELRASGLLYLHLVTPRTGVKTTAMQSEFNHVCLRLLAVSFLRRRNEKRHVPVTTARLGFDEGLRPKLLRCRSI